MKLARTSIAAWPDASVTTVLPCGKVAPAFDLSSDVKATVAPDTELPNLSRTVTRSGLNATPTCAACPLPVVAVTVAGGEDGVTVAVSPKEIRAEAFAEA